MVQPILSPLMTVEVPAYFSPSLLPYWGGCAALSWFHHAEARALLLSTAESLTPREPKTSEQSTPRFVYSRCCYPAMSSQCAELSILKSDSKSAAYEAVLKQRSREVWREIGPERMSGLNRRGAVRRFVRGALGYWALSRPCKPQRLLAAVGLAERAGFKLTVHFQMNRRSEVMS